MPANPQFNLVQSINHNGTVVVFGEAKGESTESKPSPHKLLYKVLDLEQVADVDNPSAWDDNTRWTDWMEVPYPAELRCAGMSMLTLQQEITDDMQTESSRWQVLSDGSHIYLFRAIDVAEHQGWTASPALLRDLSEGEPSAEADADSGVSTADSEPQAEATDIRVYANRYTLQRDASPAGGKNRGASGKEITVPQLKPVYEARYRRSAMRETPQSDIDGQGYLDMGNELFIEPTIEFSMVTPVDGLFTVALAPSRIPGRKRWQFFWKEADKKLAALSLLRGEDGWVDLDDKYDLFNCTADPYRLILDRIFEINHAEYGTLELMGRPDSIMFRSQEESSGWAGDKEQMLSPERVLLTARFMTSDDGSPGEEHLVGVDFDLDDDGIPVIPETLTIDTVDFARTALHLNGETDQIVMPEGVPGVRHTMSFWAWVRHNQGEGTLVERGYDPETEQGQGFAIEWRPGQKKLVATLALGEDGGDSAKVFVEAPMPASHIWHHIALVVSEGQAALHIDGALAGGEVKLPEGTPFHANGEMIVGGRSKETPVRNWLDFEIDQVVLWKDARQPSINTIYYELTDTELEDSHLLGCWQMDDAHAGEPHRTQDSSLNDNDALIEGADHVNQTAPIFKRLEGEFEDRLSGLSVGMGLIKFADQELVDDPHLFLSADGLIHLYTSARPIDPSNSGNEDKLGELVVLQYDTSSTRPQFRFVWTATVEGTERSEEGELLLTARASGPIMNRAQLTLEKDGNALKLVIRHPGLELEESWRKLPPNVEDLIVILNGEASADRADEAVQKGEKIFYAYDKHVRYNGKPLPGVVSEGKVQPVASPTFMAGGIIKPNNGAEPLLSPQPATRRWRPARRCDGGPVEGQAHGPEFSGRFCSGSLGAPRRHRH
jgi:hypothetical protein